MYKVEFRTNAERFQEKIIEGNVIVNDFINEYGGAVGTVTLNGAALTHDELNKRFNEIAEIYDISDNGKILLFDSPKTANA